MKAIITSALLFLFCGGCTTSSPILAGNGARVFVVKCSATALDACYEEAANVCPKGYNMVEHHANPATMIVPVGGSVAAVSTPNSMVIQCRD